MAKFPPCFGNVDRARRFRSERAGQQRGLGCVDGGHPEVRTRRRRMDTGVFWWVKLSEMVGFIWFYHEKWGSDFG